MLRCFRRTSPSGEVERWVMALRYYYINNKTKKGILLLNKCLGRHASACFFSSVVVCLNCSGICAVTFFSPSALASLCSLWFPQSAVFYVCFSLESQNWQGREEQRRQSETWENEMRWLFILPAKATYLFRVALERSLKQHQRPCTRITCLTPRGGLEGRV